MPEFSIIIPVYNRPILIKRAVHSVLDQSFGDFELIIIDDGSTDETGSVVDDLQKADARVLVEHQLNEGRCAARNQGLKMASGRWICFLDSDDFYYPNHLDVFHRSMADHPHEVVFATRLKTGIGHDKRINKAKNRKLVLADFTQDNPISILQVCFNREFLIKHQLGFETEHHLVIAEDLLFLRSVIVQAPIFKLGDLTAEIGEHPERSMYTEGIARIIHCNHLGTSLFLKKYDVDSSIAKKMKIYGHRLAADLWLKANDVGAARTEISALLSFGWAFFLPRTYWTLTKYALKSVLK